MTLRCLSPKCKIFRILSPEGKYPLNTSVIETKNYPLRNDIICGKAIIAATDYVYRASG